MIIEGVICLVGVTFTLPGIIAETGKSLIDSFEFWMQFLPQVVLVLALVLQLHKKTRILSIVTAGVSLCGEYFLLIFNSQNSSYKICTEFKSICPEHEDLICEGTALAVWEAIMYLLGLCLMVIGNTLLIKNSNFQSKSQSAVVEPESPKESE